MDLGLFDDSAHCGVWEMQAPRVAGALRPELGAVTGWGGEWGHVGKYPHKTVSQLTLPCVAIPALPLCTLTHPPHLWGATALPLLKHGACFSTALSFIRCALTFAPREHLLESFSVSSVCCPHKPSLSHANVTWL